MSEPESLHSSAMVEPSTLALHDVSCDENVQFPPRSPNTDVRGSVFVAAPLALLKRPPTPEVHVTVSAVDVNDELHPRSGRADSTKWMTPSRGNGMIPKSIGVGEVRSPVTFWLSKATSNARPSVSTSSSSSPVTSRKVLDNVTLSVLVRPLRLE